MKNSIIITYIVFITAVLSACNSKNKEADSTIPQNAITDSLIATLETMPVEISNIANETKLNGIIEPDETKEANVFALVSGKVISVNAELGDYVKKGAALATLKSAEIAGDNARQDRQRRAAFARGGDDLVDVLGVRAGEHLGEFGDQHRGERAATDDRRQLPPQLFVFHVADQQVTHQERRADAQDRGDPDQAGQRLFEVEFLQALVLRFGNSLVHEVRDA